MTRVYRALLIVIAGAGMITACAESPAEPLGSQAPEAPQAAVVRERISGKEVTPFSTFVPCANGGAGEVVSGIGTINFHLQLLQDANGRSHQTVHINTQGWSGVGEVTGTTYRASGNTHQSIHFGPELPTILKIREALRFVGTGGGAKFSTEFNVQLVVSASGNVTVDRMEASTTCR